VILIENAAGWWNEEYLYYSTHALNATRAKIAAEPLLKLQ